MAEIFVIDDEYDVIYLLKKVLKDEGHSIKTASRGWEAIGIIKDGYRPDLILLDVMMPDINGWEVSKKIRGMVDYDPKIAMLTIRGEEEDKARSFDEAKADWHISKPFRNENLIETVRWLLGDTQGKKG